MPGEPGPSHSGGAPHASDAMRGYASDTPYGGSISLPMTTGTVGGRAYGSDSI